MKCKKYIQKILIGHGWENEGGDVNTLMSYDKAYLQKLATTLGPIDTIEMSKLQRDKGFKFRQAVGELMFAAVTCQLDILFSVVYVV